jgi:hypothetical protein
MPRMTAKQAASSAVLVNARHLASRTLHHSAPPQMLADIVQCIRSLTELVSSGLVPVGSELRDNPSTSPARRRSWPSRGWSSDHRRPLTQTTDQGTQTTPPNISRKRRKTSQGSQTPQSPSGSSKREVTDRVHWGRVKKRWPENLKRHKPRGLPNGSTFCYQNSILQCLLHQPQFYSLLLDVRHREVCDGQRCLWCAMVDLLNAYWHDNKYKSSAPLTENQLENLREVIWETVPEGDQLYTDVKSNA